MYRQDGSVGSRGPEDGVLYTLYAFPGEERIYARGRDRAADRGGQSVFPEKDSKEIGDTAQFAESGILKASL